MALNESLIYAFPETVVGKIGDLAMVLQALGGVIILYLIFNVINTFLNRKKNKYIKNLSEDVADIKRYLKNKDKRKKRKVKW